MAGTVIRTARHEIVLVSEHAERLFDRSNLLSYLVGWPLVDRLIQNPADQRGTGQASNTSERIEGTGLAFVKLDIGPSHTP
jgi:hypothetical protein